MIEEGDQGLLQAHHPGRAAGVQDVQIDREPAFQVGELEQALHEHLGLDVAAFGLKHEAHVLGGLVTHIAQQRRLLGLDESRQLLDQIGLLDLIRDLGDHDLVGPAAGVLPRPAGPRSHPAASRLIGLHKRGVRLDDHPTGGKVRPLHMDHQVGDRSLWIVEQKQTGVDQFGGIVRRDGGRHPHGDAARAVGQKIGKAGGQDHRLLVFAVIGRAKVDGVLVDAVQQKLGGLGQAALGVAHGRGVIAVDIAEIPLAIDQLVALGEVLGEAHQSLVDSGVAVRVILADDIAHNAGRLLGRGVRIQPELTHGVKQPAVHRLQPVAHVGQGATGDGRERIGQVAPRQRLGQRFVDDAVAVVVRRRGDVLAH